MTAERLLLLRPRGFGLDLEAARTNVFQTAHIAQEDGSPRAAAAAEFEGLVANLRAAGAELDVLDEPQDSRAVDAVFLNNWFSTHACGTLVLYPMANPVRRIERRADLIEAIQERVGAREVWDLTAREADQRFLEGTGSLVLDREARVAFAGRSQRTDEGLVREWCERMGYRPVLFDTEFRGVAVYHTNVLLSVAGGARASAGAVWCPQAVVAADRERVAGELAAGGRRVCELDLTQLAEFCGNTLRVRVRDAAAWVMSSRARRALRPAQLEELGRVVDAELGTIETVGGGSARCMLAEAEAFQTVA